MSYRGGGGWGAGSSQTYDWSNTARVATVQQLPQTKLSKKYIVVDAAHRDWVAQPNPYSNLIFSFGSQVPTFVSCNVVYNNPFVPLYASNASGNPNTAPGISNTSGWYYTPTGGVPTFFPPYSPGSPPGPNCNLPNDKYYVQASGSGFGTVDQATYVTSIRAVRVTLPQKQFLNIPIIPGNVDSSGIVAQMVGKTYSAFSTYPYLLLKVETYAGSYIGGNEPTRKALSAITRDAPTQTDFGLDIGVQHYDYKPWGSEAYVMPSVIPSLQKLTIELNDPIGNTFSQQDTFTVRLVQADSTGLYLKCFTADYQYFSSNELRVGDRIIFHNPTLLKMEESLLTPKTKKAFIQNLMNTPFLVMSLLDYVNIGNGVMGPRSTNSNFTRNLPYVGGFNGFIIPNFLVTDADGNATPLYPDSINQGNSNVLEPLNIVGSNLPFLNTSLQPIYTLELTCASPDTSVFQEQNIV